MPPADERPLTSRRFHPERVLPIALSHFVHDVYTALLVPLLPLLIERLGLSLFQASTLAVFQRVPSLLNPVFGALADRHRLLKLFAVLGPSVTGVLMSVMGLAPSYAALALILLTVGTSAAVYHASAPVLVARWAGPRLGRGTAWFQVGGEVARTAGPLLAVQAVSAWSLEGSWRLAPLAVVSSLLLWWRLGPTPPRPPRSSGGTVRALWRDAGRVLLAVAGVIAARSFLVGAVTTFLPTYLVERGESLWLAGASLSLLEVAGVFGVLGAGPLSDHLGRRIVVLGASLLAPPLLLGLLAARGVLAAALLLGLGFTALSTNPVLMAAVLEAAGPNRGAANGTYMALSFGLRSAVLLLVGAMGDAWGLERAFQVSALAGLAGAPLALWLPGRKGKSGPEMQRG